MLNFLKRHPCRYQYEKPMHICTLCKFPIYQSPLQLSKQKMQFDFRTMNSNLFSDAQPNMAGGSNWGKIWRWIFQRSNDRGSVPLPLGSLLIVLAEQTCARFSGGPRKCYIIVACNHFATENWWLWMAIKGDMIFIRRYQKVIFRKLSTKDENTRLTMTCWRYAGIIALVGS